MTQLPFLVVHGAIVWKMLLALLVAASCLVVRRWRWWKVALAALATWSLVLYGIGRVAVSDADKPVSEIAPFGRLAIAAALPGSRAAALAELRWIGFQHVSHDEAGLQLGLAIDRLGGRCEAYRLSAAARLDEALAAARRCGDETQVVDLLVELGRYDEAAARVNPYSPTRATLVYIAAGRWRDAVMTSGEMEAAASDKDKDAARCLHELIGAWAGDGSAELDAEPGAVCQLIRQVARGQPSVKTPETDRFASQLFDGESVRISMRAASPWLAAIDGGPGDEPRQQRVIHLLLVGALEAAARELAAAPPTDNPYAQRDLQVLLALRANTALPPPRKNRGLVDQAERFRRGSFDRDDSTSLFVTPSRCPLAQGVESALGGDGGPLAEVFRTCDVTWNDYAPWLPAVLPRVTRHREELAAMVRRYRNQPTTNSPFELVSDFALYRDMSRLIGDDEEAQRWQAIIERHAAMLSDRRRVIALAIWSQL